MRGWQPWSRDRSGHGKDLRRVRPGLIGVRNHRGLFLLNDDRRFGFNLVGGVRLGVNVLNLLGIETLSRLGFGRLDLICSILGLIGNRKGLGDGSTLLLERYRGIELRGIERLGGVDWLLGLKGRRSLGDLRRGRLLSLMLFKFPRRTLTLGLGSLLVGNSLLLCHLARSGTLFLKVVDKFFTLSECALKEA